MKLVGAYLIWYGMVRPILFCTRFLFRIANLLEDWEWALGWHADHMIEFERERGERAQN